MPDGSIHYEYMQAPDPRMMRAQNALPPTVTHVSDPFLFNYEFS